MNKQAYLEETYNSAFNDELEKIALNRLRISNLFKKRISPRLSPNFSSAATATGVKRKLPYGGIRG